MNGDEHAVIVFDAMCVLCPANARFVFCWVPDVSQLDRIL
jgi:hypothetical protein